MNGSLYSLAQQGRRRAAKELRVRGEFSEGSDEGIFADDGKSIHGFSDADLETLDGILARNGLRNTMLALKDLLSSQTELDTLHLDAKRERAVQALSLLALDAKFKDV